MTPDQQRQRVYDAEQRVCAQLDFAARGARAVTVHGSTLTVGGDVRFGSRAAAEAWLDRVRAQPWFAARWPVAARVPLVVRPRRGGRAAHYEGDGQRGVIAVPVPGNATGWAMREMVLAHELAHHVVACEPHSGGEPAPASHGGVFTAAMLELVGHAVGDEPRLLLTAAYHDSGVTVGSVPGGGPRTGQRGCGHPTGAAP